MSELDAAIDHVYSVLGHIPHSEYGYVTLMPFAHESDQVNKFKRQVAEGLVGSLASQGMITKATPAEPSRSVKVLCRSCSQVLFTATTDHDGGILVNAPALLSMLSQLSLECPHQPQTAHDLRRFLEENAQ